jgi:hypothetical protein
MFINSTILVDQPPGAEILDVTGTKVLRVSFLMFRVTSSNELTPLPNKSSLKPGCNVNNVRVYGNLKPENSQEYAQKLQQTSTFVNSGSVLYFK